MAIKQTGILATNLEFCYARQVSVLRNYKGLEGYETSAFSESYRELNEGRCVDLWTQDAVPIAHHYRTK